MKRCLLLLCIGLLLLPQWAETATDEETGATIAQEAERRDSGWGDVSSHITMVLINPNGDKRKRVIRSRALEVSGDGDKRLMIFEYPPNMRGTGFLSYSHKITDDDQWLYLPNLKRVRRIASRSRSDSFLGSEFAYEDISGDVVEKYHYRWLRDEMVDDHDCFVVESRPVDRRNSGYSRRISYIDKRDYYPLKIDFYNRHDLLLKTLTFTGYQRYLERFWRADVMEMVNHKNGRATRLMFADYRFKIGLTDSDFSRRAMMVGR